MKNSTLFSLRHLAIGAVVAAGLAACGGDDTPRLNIKGVAATGAAIDGASVSVQCKSGSATAAATTSANGSYAVEVANGEGPCVVTVTKGTLVLRSITSLTTTGVAVANVTPISNAIVTALVTAKGAATPAELVTKATAIPSNADLTAAVAQTVTAINAALTAAGAPASALLAAGTDLLNKSDFVAATSTTPSADPIDKALDLLKAKIGSTGALAADVQASVTSGVDTAVEPTPATPTGAS